MRLRRHVGIALALVVGMILGYVVSSSAQDAPSSTVFRIGPGSAPGQVKVTLVGGTRAGRTIEAEAIRVVQTVDSLVFMTAQDVLPLKLTGQR